MSEGTVISECPGPFSKAELDEAIRLGMAVGNQLLLDYCVEYGRLQNKEWPSPLLRSSLPLRWLDMDLTPDDHFMTYEELLRGKIHRTKDYIQSLRDGHSYMCYVDIPAYNEAEEIPALLASLRSQIVEAPVALVVADNNSTDNTSEIVRWHGGNVLLAPKQGAGAARQVALEASLADTPATADKTIIVQTDADSVAYPGYLAAIIQGFRAKRGMCIGVGPSQYTIPVERGETLRIRGGNAYGALLGTQGMRGYFEKYNRDVGDYLLTRPFRYLVGPNTTYRASLFTNHNLSYQTDGRWEVLDLAVRAQQKLPSSEAIGYIDGQYMEVSPRAILGGDKVLTGQRLQDIRAAGYVGMYKKDGNAQTPFTTMGSLLQEIDSQTYDLPPDRQVVGVVTADHPMAKVYEVRPAIHAATSALVVGKVALIA